MPRIDGFFSQPMPVIRFLDTVGNGSGNKNIAGNYAAAPQSFKMIVPAGLIYIISSFNVHISDSGNFTSGGFGANALPLTNGFQINAKMNGNIGSLIDNMPIKTNANFLHISQDTTLLTAFSGGGNVLSSTFTPTSFGIAGYFNGDKGDYLEIIVNDDLTFIKDFHAIVKGYV